jgi:hypothetical protein
VCVYFRRGGGNATFKYQKFCIFSSVFFPYFSSSSTCTNTSSTLKGGERKSAVWKYA